MEEMEVGSEGNDERDVPEETSSENEMSDDEEMENDEKSDDTIISSDSSDVEDTDEAEAKALEASLTKNPYDYASHVALIGKLHKMGELDRLRVARENMSNVYPLSPELWLSWMRDEIKLATTAEQRAEVVKLCERAVKDYLCKSSYLCLGLCRSLVVRQVRSLLCSCG